MKKYITLLLLVVFSGVYAQNKETLFKEANAFYQTENYQKAIEKYEQMVVQNFTDTALFYNLGNAYYKTNQMAEAIYYYEKALVENPANKDAKINLNFANRSIIDSIKVLPKTTFEKFNDSVLALFSYNTWAKIAVALSLLGGSIWLLFFFSTQPGVKKLYFTLAILVTVACGLSLAVTAQQYNRIQKEIYAIVFADEIEVKNAPRTGAGELFTLHEGTKVKVLDSVGVWQKIKIADGQVGWLPKETIKKI